MKSNLNKLFYEVIDSYKQRGVFKVDELVDQFIPNLKIESGGEYHELLRTQVKEAVTTLLNINDCYKLKNKGEFIWLENASLVQLCTIDDNISNGIKKKQKRLEKVREYERNIINGQQAFVFSGNMIIGTQEEKSLSAM